MIWQQLEELQDSFEKLLDNRNQEIALLTNRLETFIATQHNQEQHSLTERVNDRRREMEQQETERLEGLKELKEQREMEEREYSRNQAEQTRELQQKKSLRKVMLRIALLIVTSILTGIMFTGTFVPSSMSSNSLFQGYLALFSVSSGFFAWFTYLRWTRQQSLSELALLARGRVPSLKTLDQTIKQVARPSDGNTTQLMELLDRDPNPQVRYAATKALGTLVSIMDRFEFDRLLAAFRREAWLKAQVAMLDTIIKFSRSKSISIRKELINILDNASDSQAVYLIDALERSGEDLGPILQRLVESICQRPAYVVLHALFSGVIPRKVYKEQVDNELKGFRSSSDSLALGFALVADDDSAPARLADIYSKRSFDSTNYTDALIEADLTTLAPKIVQEVAELFGLGSENSLGYYDDLKNGILYDNIYQFFFQIRLALEELKLTRDSSKMS